MIALLVAALAFVPGLGPLRLVGRALLVLALVAMAASWVLPRRRR